MSAARRIIEFSGIISEREFAERTEQKIFTRKAVTKQYDHSRPINLKKLPAFYWSRVDGQQTFISKTQKYFCKVTNEWRIKFTTEEVNQEKDLSLHEFLTNNKYYDSTVPGYYDMMQKCQINRTNRMTAQEFFNQNRRRYDPLTYDIIVDPGFKSRNI